MVKKTLCPQECQDKHTNNEITMTKIFGKLDNIEYKLEENTKQHLELIDMFKEVANKKADKDAVNMLHEVIKNKADEKDMKDLKGKYWAAVAGFVALLLTIIFLLVKILSER